MSDLHKQGPKKSCSTHLFMSVGKPWGGKQETGGIGIRWGTIGLHLHPDGQGGVEFISTAVARFVKCPKSCLKGVRFKVLFY